MKERLNRRVERTMLKSSVAGAGAVIAGGVIGITTLPEAGVAIMHLGILSPLVGMGVELNRLRRDKRRESANNQVEQASRKVNTSMPFPLNERRDPVPLISAAFSGNLKRSPDSMELLGQVLQGERIK